MALLELNSAQTGPEADLLSRQNWQANMRALSATQPTLLQSVGQADGIEWAFARDGFLSGKDSSGAWISGCSLPRLAAREMMKEMTLNATVACFICPNHAAQIDVAMESSRANQAIMVVIESIDELSVILHCHDFSGYIEAHRLLFAAGADWAGELDRLFSTYPGLPTPATFIRLVTTTQEIAERVIATAQGIISNVSAKRTQEIQRLSQSWRAPEFSGRSPICLVAPSTFRLWDDAGETLASVAGAIGRGAELHRVDPDDPTSSSPLAVAKAAAECQFLLATNFARADAPQLLPAGMPWITWLTVAKIPAHATAGRSDQLLVAAPAWVEMAVQAGWPRDRVHVATWPTMRLASPATGAPLAIIADTAPVAALPEQFDLSSHSLLWELIYSELSANPFLLDDIGRYLNQRMRRLNISEEHSDYNRFIEQLIVPLYQQGMARAICSARLPLVIHGTGWDLLPEFAPCATGPIRDRSAFERAMQECAAVVDVWPLCNPAASAGRSLVRHSGSRESLIRNARAILMHPDAVPPATAAPLSGPLLARTMAIKS